MHPSAHNRNLHDRLVRERAERLSLIGTGVSDLCTLMDAYLPHDLLPIDHGNWRPGYATELRARRYLVALGTTS